MNRCSLEHHCEGSPRKSTSIYDNRFNFNQGFVFAIDSVKMRWIMVVEKDADHDSKEAAYLRHEDLCLCVNDAPRVLSAKTFDSTSNC